MMAGALVSASTGVMTSLLGKLTALLGDEYNLLQRVRSDVEFLHRELSSMEAMLRRLAGAEGLDDQMRDWRDKVRELAYDVEDCIDVFMHKVDGADGKAGFKSKITNLLNLGARHKISHQMKELKARVAEENERRLRYKLDSSIDASRADQHSSMSATVDIDRRLQALYVQANQLVGIDGPIKEISDLLLEEAAQSSSAKLKVVSIVGFGGLGKTTLAYQVFRKIKGQFDFVKFVFATQSPNIKKILMDIGPVAERNDSRWDDQWQLIDNTRNFLQDKRYLIVVDDIWSHTTWEHLKFAFPENNNHSRIITTTRNIGVASSCWSKPNDYIYRMVPLSDPDSEKLFFRRIFISERRCPHPLKDISNSILKKCGGLPLAIITIASLLVNKSETKKEWKEVYDSIGYAHELQGMRKILSLSFYDLPQDLKTCFLYLGVFPEDHEIERERLVLRWIAEGFISRNGDQGLEQIGENYFNKLVNRSMIQPIDIQYNGRARACRVHDLMLELIISLSKAQNFVTILDGQEHPSLSSKIRRLSLHSKEDALIQLTMNSRSHLRSLSLFPSANRLPHFLEFQALRVLDIKGCHFLEDQKLKVGSLIQLKYLNLSDTSITELPKQIGDLQCLESLDLRQSRIKSLPSTLCQLRKLVRLFVSVGVTLPERIGNMQALQELSHVAILCNSPKFVKELSRLTKLRVLRVDCQWRHANGDCDVGRYEKILVSSLCTLGENSLQVLELNPSDESLVYSFIEKESFSQESVHYLSHLEELIISNYVSKVPRCISLLKDLSHLEIKLNRLEEEDLHILRDMSASLLFLRLHLGVCQRLVVDVEGFQCLKEFDFRCDDGGMGLAFAPGAMPQLEKIDLDIGVRETLSIYNDFDFGIKNLDKLRHVGVKLNCRGASNREVEDADAKIRSQVLPRRLTPQIQRIGIVPCSQETFLVPFPFSFISSYTICIFGGCFKGGEQRNYFAVE